MKPKKRQKLCHNCEGEIDIDVIVCPFCAADLRDDKPEQRYSSYVSTTQQMSQKHTMQPLYPVQENRVEPIYKEPAPEEIGVMEQEVVEEKKNAIFTPTILFTVGVQLCIFGLLMLLFSHKGVVILKWDARFWFFYVFASIPFLVFGYKALSKL